MRALGVFASAWGSTTFTFVIFRLSFLDLNLWRSCPTHDSTSLVCFIPLLIRSSAERTAARLTICVVTCPERSAAQRTRLLLRVKGHGRLQVFLSRQILYGHYIISSSLVWLGLLALPYARPQVSLKNSNISLLRSYPNHGSKGDACVALTTS